MAEADAWFMCRIGYLETIRAVGLAAGRAATGVVRREWDAIDVIEVDQRLVEEAADLSLHHDLRSLDALHLASALLLARHDLVVLTWDRRLHAAARSCGLRVLPEALA